jgi:hypothetical protein
LFTWRQSSCKKTASTQKGKTAIAGILPVLPEGFSLPSGAGEMIFGVISDWALLPADKALSLIKQPFLPKPVTLYGYRIESMVRQGVIR